MKILQKNLYLDRTRVSVIILNWNGGNYLMRCVKSVLEADYPKDLLEVIMVDGGSTDGSAKSVKRMFPRVKIVQNHRNLGFCVGNNIGIANASGNLLILLNNDTIVDKNWVYEILKIAKDPQVGIVGCRLYFPETRIIQSLGLKTKFIGYWASIGAGQEDNGQFNDVNDVHYVSGAAMAIKKDVLKRIGLLDPNFYAYAEDVDLCYRAMKAGYRVVTSNAIVYHYGSLSWDYFPLRKEYLNARNRLYFIMKHYSPKTLLTYIFEYPLKSFKLDLHRFLKRETVLQRTEASRKNSHRGKTSIQALTMVFLRAAMFSIALLSTMVSTKNRIRSSEKHAF